MTAPAASGAITRRTCRWWVRARSRYAVWPPHMRQEIRLAADVFPELEPRVQFRAPKIEVVSRANDKPGPIRLLKGGELSRPGEEVAG